MVDPRQIGLLPSSLHYFIQMDLPKANAVFRQLALPGRNELTEFRTYLLLSSKLMGCFQEAWPGIMPNAFEGTCFPWGIQMPLMLAREAAGTLTEPRGLQYLGGPHAPRSGPGLFRNILSQS